MSKLKLCLFRIFLAVWKFQIRDRGRGGYCGSSWISLSSVHNSSHRLHFKKKLLHSTQCTSKDQLVISALLYTQLAITAALQQNIARQYVVHLNRACQYRACQYRACQYRACQYRACQNCSTLTKYKKVHLNGSSCYNSTCKLYNCRRKLCYNAKKLCLLLFQCKLHWLALNRISEQCLETAIVQNRKQLLAVVQ